MGSWQGWSPSLAGDMSGAAPQQGQQPPEGGDGGLAESLAAVRSRARRGKRGEPESGQQAVVSLLKEDRLRRLESRFQEDREARLRLEVTAEAQQRTIKALEQQLQFAQSEGREAQRIAARSAPLIPGSNASPPPHGPATQIRKGRG